MDATKLLNSLCIVYTYIVEFWLNPHFCHVRQNQLRYFMAKPARNELEKVSVKSVLFSPQNTEKARSEKKNNVKEVILMSSDVAYTCIA